jgi:CheY-like chemotaxis protein
MSSDDLQSAARDKASPADPAAGRVGPRLRVLFVEDHSDTRMSMEILLRRADYYVQSAETAAGALELAAKEKFDVVITDIGLPDMSGVELMNELRATYGLEGIATTGYGEEDELQRNGGDFLHHLTKPIKMEELRHLLDEVQILKRPES